MIKSANSYGWLSMILIDMYYIQCVIKKLWGYYGTAFLKTNIFDTQFLTHFFKIKNF